jgi:hypothetical protein
LLGHPGIAQHSEGEPTVDAVHVPSAVSELDCVVEHTHSVAFAEPQ